MANNIRILHHNEIDDAGIAASSEVTNYPVTNIQNEQRKKKWRSTGANAEWIKINKTGFAAKCIAIAGHNLPYGAQITVKANYTDSWASPAFSQTFFIWGNFWSQNRMGVGEGGIGEGCFGGWDIDINEYRRLVAFRPIFIGYFISEQHYPWWGIEFSDVSNVNNYIEIGRLYIGDYFEAYTNFSYGSTEQVIDQSQILRTPGGIEYIDQLPIYHQFNLPLNHILNTEYQRQLMMLQETFGQHKFLFIDLYANWSDYSREFFGHFYGRLAPSPVSRAKYNTNAMQLQFVETI